MKKRIILFTLLVLSSTLSICFADTYKVAIVKTKDAFSYNETLKGYKRYVGNTKKYKDRKRIKIKIDEYNIQGNAENSGKIIDEIKYREYDIVLTLGRRAFEAIKDEIKDTPVIFATMFNPYDGDGQPGEDDSNVTGIEMDIPPSVQFEALKSFVPFLQNVGVIYSDNDKNLETLANATKVADELGLNLVQYEVNDERDVAETLEKLIKETDALWMIPDYSIYSKEIIKHVVLTTIENEFPFMGLSKAYVKAGALIAVSRDFQDIGRQAAIMSFNIIKDGLPDEQRILPLRKYPMVINKRTADSIDIRIPQWVSENTIEFFE
ncbi:ABC transporter substrate-binding protein [Thermodesulfobacteriota bacterium]